MRILSLEPLNSKALVGTQKRILKNRPNKKMQWAAGEACSFSFFLSNGRHGQVLMWTRSKGKVIAQIRQVVYVENTPMFVQSVESLGIRSILHTDYGSTCAKLVSFGLQNNEGVIHETR
jgi:hypothetical protein